MDNANCTLAAGATSSHGGLTRLSTDHCGRLAVGFLGSGVQKLIQPKDKLYGGKGWVEDYSAASIKAIGVLEILAAIGLILPAALDIAPVLVPLAAVGLVALMLGAFIAHVDAASPRESW